ncbi:protocadherin Fat 1, partial [Caerostris extrusa]
MEKEVCKCPPEYDVLDGKCKACNCGAGSNCTFTCSGWLCWYPTKECICKEGYKEISGTCVGPCSTNPCKNEGTCRVEGKSFKCDCKRPFKGNTCEEGPCSTNPCKNLGTCKVDGQSFKCDCKPPFKGHTCEEGPCSTNPCKNEGTCRVEGKSFKCECKRPFKGNTCEEGPCST